MTSTAATPVELEPQHAEIVSATLPLIGAHIDEITAEFYRRMFGSHPELLRNLFNRGNQAQGAQQRALAASIATFATLEQRDPVAFESGGQPQVAFGRFGLHTYMLGDRSHTVKS